MKTAHLITAKRDIARAHADDISRFSDVPVGNIVDAMGRSGAMHHAIKAMTRANRFCGSALTIDAGPRDNLVPWAALKLAQPGDVMVIATGGHLGHSVCGDIMIRMAANAGVAAIVTDGVTRDVTGANKAGIPVFAAGVSPNSPQKNGPGSVGFPVVAGGVAVAAGDIVCGDEDGVVVVPATRIGEVTEALRAVLAKEASMEAAASAGATAPDWVTEASLDDLFTLAD